MKLPRLTLCRLMATVAVAAVLLAPLRVVPDSWHAGARGGVERGFWLTYAGTAFCTVNVDHPDVFVFWGGYLTSPLLFVGRDHWERWRFVIGGFP